LKSLDEGEPIMGHSSSLDRARIVELHGQGKSQTEIARELHRARSTVARHLVKAGQPLTPDPTPAASVEAPNGSGRSANGSVLEKLSELLDARWHSLAARAREVLASGLSSQ
jgi:hypothetical protein